VKREKILEKGEEAPLINPKQNRRKREIKGI